MAYLFRQKLQIGELANVPSGRGKILVYEPERDLGILHAHYLRAHSFEVLQCDEISKLKPLALAFNPDLFIFSADGEFSTNSFRRFRSNFPQLAAISIGFNLGSEGVGELMSAGVSSHINRKLSRPEDLPILVKTILGYSGGTTEPE